MLHSEKLKEYQQHEIILSQARQNTKCTSAVSYKVKAWGKFYPCIKPICLSQREL